MVINDFNLFDVHVTSSLNNGTIELRIMIGLKHMPQLIIKYSNQDITYQQLHAIMPFCTLSTELESST